MILNQQKLLRRGLRSVFTLMEMMVVVAILVVLVGVAVPSYMSYLESSKEKRARTDVETIFQISQKFKIDNGQYPQSIQELLTTMQPGGTSPYLKQNYRLDPWDQEYIIDPQGTQMKTLGEMEMPDVFSKGRPNANPPNPIGNWLKPK